MASSFPLEGLLPKHEIQASSFIQKFPQYDGRGVRVAILDTGVDPAAAGMGPNKVVDIIDCSGSGDVHTHPVTPKESKDGDKRIFLPSLTGRLVAVSPDWKNPTNTWRIGYKRAWDFWPDGLQKRRIKDRTPCFEEESNKLLTKALAELNVFKDKKSPSSSSSSSSPSPSNTEPTPPTSANGKSTPAVNGTSTTSKDKVEQEKEKEPTPPSPPSDKFKEKELEARVQALKELASQRSDLGPVLEVVTWHDGDNWRCVVGGAEGDNDQGTILPFKDEDIVIDLSDKKPMTDYRLERHYETFGTRDLLSYSVNILNEGETVSLVTLSGSHGTHVAGIVGAHHPENPEANGVAPGVEIVSIKISDARVGTMETHQALTRACRAIIDSKCDIVNMSFGEASSAFVDNKGQFIQQLRDEVIRKRDVIFCTSAGNAGPGLSTVGAPAGSTDGIISVGAYVTSAMQKAEYALLDDVPPGPYTWTSRGPTPDGASGVTVMSLGGAITSVPKYGLHVRQLMNGTSMASPSACGAISLVLSALKEQKIPYTSARIEKALRDSSKDIHDLYIDAGLIQVQNLYEYILKNKEFEDQDAVFDVSITPVGKPSARSMRGVYLRGEEETRQLYQAIVQINPSFKKEETERAYNLELKLSLQASAPWIKVPDYLVLANNGRGFNINVEPQGLTPGYHHAEISAYDTSSSAKRKIFTIPVTVTKPIVPDSPIVKFENMPFKPGHIERRWVSVPKGATQVSFKATSKGNDKPMQFWLSANQIQPLQRHDHTEKAIVVSLNDGEPYTTRLPVTSALPLELALVQGWNSLPTAKLDFEVEFFGLIQQSTPETAPQDSVLTINGGQGLQPISVLSQLRVEKIEPKIKFHHKRRFLRPSKSSINPLTSRDLLLNGKQLLELQLTYDVKVSANKKVQFSWPTSGKLYDSSFGVLGFVFDANKRLVQTLDVYDRTLNLSKGDYKIKLQLTHESYDVLEKAKTMPVIMDTELEGSEANVSLDFYWDQVDAFSGSPAKFNGSRLFPGDNSVFMVKTELTGEGKTSILKDSTVGEVLLGNMTVTPKVAVKNGIKVEYILPPAPREENNGDDKDSTPPSPPLLVDLQLSILSKIENEEERTKFLDNLIKENPKHLPALVAKLDSLKIVKSKEGNDAAEKKGNTPEEVIAACDAILETVGESGEDELAKYLGSRRPEGSEQDKEEKELKRKMDLTKNSIKKAYDRKLLTLIERDGSSASSSEGFSPEAQQVWKRYERWLEPYSSSKDIKSGLNEVRRELARDRPGVALTTANAILKQIGEASADEDANTAIELKKQALEKLDWKIWQREEVYSQFVKRPPGGYQEF